MIHRRAGGQLGFEVIEGGRRAPAAWCVPGIGGKVPQRQDPPPTRIAETGRSVHGQEVEEDGVTRLQVESPDVERVAVGLDLRQFRQASLGKPAGLPVQERPRHEPGAAVRAGHQLQAPVLGHRVHRDPRAHATTVDVVVGLVLMPRRVLPGPAFLDQDVIMVEADLRRGHQSGRESRNP